jgi:hypothetical protein
MKNGYVVGMYKTHSVAIFMVIAMIVSMFSAISFVENAKAHLDEGIGDQLQLYSYFDSDASTKINYADSGIGRDIGNYDEWEGAYVRNITLTNFAGFSTFCFLFLANDDSFLYIGIVYQAGNTGANNYVRIYFDEGNGAGGYDGTHDDALTANNEQYIHMTRGGVEGDGYWNGASWAADSVVDSIVDSNINFGTSYMNYELKIPLDNGVDGPTGSDLNVASTDELGIFLEFTDLGQSPDSTLYWGLTGNDPSDVNAYGDLKLGLLQKDTTVYSTFANTGNPTIDGDISNDFAYANAYSREITMTNFLGEAYRTTLYLCEDPAGDDIFVGVVIYTDNSDPTDYLRIYTDQDHSVVPPFGDKDGILSDGGGLSTENYEEIGGDNSYSDGFWDSTSEAWVDDGTAADAIDGEGEVTFKNFAGSANDRYEFEFRLPYSPVSAYQVTGIYDFYITSPQLQGILFEFYDASAPAGERFFYWDLTVNLNAIKTEETAGGIFLSTGWAYLQTGGPALKPITPITGSTVFGTDYVFRVEAEDENGYDGVNFVGFQIEGETNWISLVRESTTNGIWFTYWDTTALSDGKYNITIVAQDDEGVAVKKIITVTIANGATLNIPPTVSLTSPSSGSYLTGTAAVFQAASTGIASVVEVHLDGLLIGTMSSTGLETWQYSLDTTNWDDGVHIVNLVAKNAAGEGSDAGVYIFDNWDLNSLTITTPTSGSTAMGNISVVGDFAADNSGEYAELFVDEDFWSFSDDTAAGDVTFSVDTTLLSEGAHQVKLFVYDPEGNKLMDMVTVYVDNILPGTPTIASLVDGQFIDGTFVFKVQCDTTDLASVELTIPTVITNMPIGYNSASGYYEYSLDTTALIDGDYSVSAVSWDTAGSSASSGAVNFKIDNTAPTLAVVSPLDNAIVSGDVTFNYTAQDTYLSNVMYKIDGNSWVDILTPWDTTTFNEGGHMASIKAMDESGHYTMVTLDLVVDNNAPDIAILNPVANQFLHDDFTFRIRAEDEVGLSDVRITILNTDSSTAVVDDISIILNEVSGHYEYTMDTMTLLDGNYSITATAYDMSGKDSGDDSVNFMVDNHAPMLMLTAPLNGELLTDSVPIDVDYFDVFLVDMVYRIDGGAWVDLGVAWDTSLVNDGGHTIDIKLTDEAGHMTMQTVSVSTDNNAPELYPVYWPSENIAKSFKIQIYAMDAVELVEVTYQMDNLTPVMMFQNIATGFYEAEIVVESFSDEEHDLTITATDSVGLSTQISTKITVDNTGPAINIVEPAKGKTVKGDVEFIVELTDDTGIKTVQISIDKGEWKDMKLEDGKYVYNWNSRKFYNGKYDVDVRAVDTLGNEAKASSDIKVDNFPMMAFLIFIIVLVVFLVLMIVSWGRKPKSKKSEIAAPIISEETEAESHGESEEGAETMETFECPECGATVGSSDSVCATCGVELEGEEKGGEEDTGTPGFSDETEGL